MPYGRLSPAQLKRMAAAQKARWQRLRLPLATAEKPLLPVPRSGSPLSEKLTAHLGRQLRRDESRFVRQVQMAFAAADGDQLTEAQLSVMVGRCPHGWQELSLWRDFPSDDFYFWLHVARELRRRGWEYPAFMAGITDLQLIEPAMEQWEREKQIEQWKAKFRQHDGRWAVPESGSLELRLAIGAQRAWFEGRSAANLRFAELNQTQANRIASQFDEGALPIAPDSLPLFSAAYRPWAKQAWWSFSYGHGFGLPALNRMLRMPLAPDRVITRDGQPLARIAEPLRLELRSPENGDGNYQLALVTCDGSPLPKILCTLAGQPTLYLTEGGLFSGPPAELLDPDMTQPIPAPALESSVGLRFLHAVGIAIPQHLSNRIRTVPVQVTISCTLRPALSSSGREIIALRVMAKAPGMNAARFTPAGWEEELEYAPRVNSEPTNGVIVVYDMAAQKHFPRVIECLDLKWEEYHREWTCRLTKAAPAQFVAWLQSLPPEIEILLDKQLASLRDGTISGQVSLDVVEAGIDWFDLKVELKLSDTTLTPEEVKMLLNARGGYVRLGRRGWRRLEFQFTAEDDEQLAGLGLDARDFSAEPQRFHALQLAHGAANKFLPPERVEAIQRRASELKLRVTPELPRAIYAKIRPYQMQGFHFLAYLTTNHFGGVLADDMGLGKTLQTLAWLAWLRETAVDSEFATRNPSLVVCPKSVMENWSAEAKRFYPSLHVHLWRAEPVTELPAAREQADLIVINYTQLRLLSSEIAAVPWLAAILDEAQYMKNPNSQTAQVARALNAEHRLALTGTPIENRLLDLWSIFAFAMPNVLGTRAQFLRRFPKDDPLARRRLAARVRPFLLRRTKAQVEPDLPDRVEEDLLCEMEGEQKTLYSAELKRARQLLLDLKTPEQLNQQRFHILTSLLRLRQICCHPALVDHGLSEVESAKVSALEDLLEPLLEEGHKTLVFSQFVTMLDLLRQKVQQHGWPHFYLAGDTENRGALVQQFQSAQGGAVFLISLRAGGFGLNLTAASYVILFDPWWNPAVENQAIDRTHRIGQTNKVMAYRLLMRDSIEQKVRALQKQKAALVEDVLGEERFAQSLTFDDLRFLLGEGTGEFRSTTI